MAASPGLTVLRRSHSGGAAPRDCALAETVSFLMNVIYQRSVICHNHDMNEVHAKINENGRIVIPAAMREALGIVPGEELVLRIEDDELRITTMRHRIERARELVRRHVKPGRSLVDELMAERRKAAQRE